MGRKADDGELVSKKAKRRPIIWVHEPAGLEERGGIFFWDMPPELDYDLCATPEIVLQIAIISAKAYNKFAVRNGRNLIDIKALLRGH